MPQRLQLSSSAEDKWMSNSFPASGKFEVIKTFPPSPPRFNNYRFLLASRAIPAMIELCGFSPGLNCFVVPGIFFFHEESRTLPLLRNVSSFLAFASFNNFGWYLSPSSPPPEERKKFIATMILSRILIALVLTVVLPSWRQRMYVRRFCRYNLIVSPAVRPGVMEGWEVTLLFGMSWTDMFAF